MDGVLGIAYLIHFDEPYKHAKHYIGWADNLEMRMKAHKHNRGARLLEVLNEAGINYHVVRIWKGVDRNFERRLKNCHKPNRFCPICSGAKAFDNMTLEKLYGPKFVRELKLYCIEYPNSDDFEVFFGH